MLVGLLLLAAVVVGRPAAGPGRLVRLVRGAARPADPEGSSGREGGDGPAGRHRRGLPDLDTPLLLDLTGAALEAGATPTTALGASAAAMAGAWPSAQDAELRRRCALLRLGASWEEAWAGASPGLDPLRAPLALALRAGAPGAGLLRDAATELRRHRARESQRRAQALGVRLVVPLGACALPAFAAVGVLPVVLALAQQVVSSGG
ncbi:type II secretion system F family protein [Pseudokineococcus basanitobsidens]|uniref:Type II secretion system F family protein n=1 Tax=Pseudokineococcus basanitobsidens TaxID=1926649 RepID=A0ABU8RK98_9ACTN